tara:strand:- start:46 stop:1521 length:1476 start_codon:yes stop_codon:yes gene_type:complete
MINIQRNFFIETILLETKFFKRKDIINLPYKDYINISNNDDLNLIFIDIDRLDNLKKIYKDIKSLKSKKKKVIFIPVSKQIKKINKFINHIEKGEFNNLIVINLNKLKISKLIDTSREKIYKSYLSLEAQLTLSKIIENIINLLSNKDIRLLSLDLDDTCWTGVIGEDGMNNIYLDNYQKKSLSYINRLILKTGLLVSFHSKNEKKLGNKGIKDKLSKYKSLVNKSFKYISWNSKLNSIKQIVNLVNFSKKNMFYFDDNISEIKQLNKFLVKENCLWIKSSYIFFLYSKSLFVSNINKEKNTKRFIDIKSNIQRSGIADTSGILNYIKTSNVKVNCSIKKINLQRFVEMSNKTNQFNANYLRLNSINLRKYKKDKNFNLITFSVSDKYSDSGIIAAIILEKKKNFFQIKEFLISCRALGRNLEYIFISQIIKNFSIKDLRICYLKTDRNEPFIKFAEKIKLKRNIKNYLININLINKFVSKYEKFIKIKIN